MTPEALCETTSRAVKLDRGVHWAVGPSFAARWAFSFRNPPFQMETFKGLNLRSTKFNRTCLVYIGYIFKARIMQPISLCDSLN